MFKPVSFFIGLRYTRAKKRNHFISFISLMSMLGIALGVLVLITVLSVMNGFDREIKERAFSMVPALTVGSQVNFVENWRELKTVIQTFPEVTAVAPLVTGQVLLTYSGSVMPAMINGIFPNEEKNISALPKKMVQGNLSSLKSDTFHVVLGQDLADHLGVGVGDKITVVTPQASVSIAGIIPRFKRFTVTGIFDAGSGFGFDTYLAFINLNDAQKLFKLNQAVTTLRVNIKNVYDAPRFSEMLSKQLTGTARINDWTSQFGAFFQAISLEKRMMFFILLLIIGVAVFNLVSTLVMVVNDKESDIAILRTIGATPRMIMAIFIIQGAIIGLIGTILGVVGGVLLSQHVTGLVNVLQHVFHVQFVSSSVYFVDYLPSELQWNDVWKISFFALGFSLLATLYPAWRASRTEPAEALRYE